ncbi:hypothetical protein SARC_03999 [Sphaeroforma arctica JP610]|uniref:Uncharacterized protein n=1 Tax=Sphaeroforma arctica JP610 TaxID=667725 RepID=A0A0L0G3Z8_9EUKA|nr:hypothetical protein SARC_03999 [Sphaeroforma arctica JP610]KNC83775.1 hypothetical protein SARC_03999 [Sphaeroforma arctica JP610]|eukprot:XP_014157677.1 hypothetical protein SARC_03999 [Sphaeroforma arctica JP610]
MSTQRRPPPSPRSPPPKVTPIRGLTSAHFLREQARQEERYSITALELISGYTLQGSTQNCSETALSVSTQITLER